MRRLSKGASRSTMSTFECELSAQERSLANDSFAVIDFGLLSIGPGQFVDGPDMRLIDIGAMACSKLEAPAEDESNWRGRD